MNSWFVWTNMKFTIYLWMLIMYNTLDLWPIIIPTPGPTKTLPSSFINNHYIVWSLQCFVGHHILGLLAPPSRTIMNMWHWQNWSTWSMWFRPFMQKLTRFPQVNKNTWSQQEGAALHMVRNSVNTINQLFHNPVITKYGHISWQQNCLICWPMTVFWLGCLTLWHWTL